jgi:hypothetical protein
VPASGGVKKALSMYHDTSMLVNLNLDSTNLDTNITIDRCIDLRQGLTLDRYIVFPQELTLDRS